MKPDLRVHRMKTKVDISLEGDEVFGFMHRLANKLCNTINDELQAEPQQEWMKEHSDERHCTFCGVVLVKGENIPLKRHSKRENTCKKCRHLYEQKHQKQQRCCFLCGVQLTDINHRHKRVYVCTGCEESGAYVPRKKITNPQHIPTTAEERDEWSRERRAIVGKKITQRGKFEGALIKKHVRGSLYIVEVLDGQEMYAHHKKQKTLGGDELGAGWRDWEKRS